MQPSFVRFDHELCLYACYIGDSRSGMVEESESGWCEEGTDVLTELGRVWSFVRPGCIRTEHFDLRVTFERPTDAQWSRVLERQLLTLPGIGKKSASQLAEAGIRLADIRSWTDEQVAHWATKTRAKIDVLASARERLRRLVTRPVEETPASG